MMTVIMPLTATVNNDPRDFLNGSESVPTVSIGSGVVRIDQELMIILK